MFKCQTCKKVQSEKKKPKKVITEVRSVTYQNYVKAGKFKRTIDSVGSEIVKEILVCETCVPSKTA